LLYLTIKRMAFFSIVIPVYNKQKDIKKTLESVLKQTFIDYEIIVVNDGSTDNSEDIILSVTDSRIRYFKTENKGASSARNFGIEKSAGAVVAFLDADDYWFPNHLEVLYDLYQTYTEAVLFAARYEFFHPNETVEKIELPGIDANFKGLLKNIFAISLKYRPLCSSCVAIKKDVFYKIGAFDTTISKNAVGEDTDMWTRIAIKYPIAYSGKTTARYILGASNRISNVKTLQQSFLRLDKFREEEKSNYSLSRFLNIYRASYALKFKLAGHTEGFNLYYKEITPAGIPLKTKVLLILPRPFLKLLFNLKQILKTRNIHFSIYD